MRIAFITGPYRHHEKSGRTIRRHIRRAEEAAVRWWKKGFAVICPHLNSGFMDGECDDDIFLQGALEFIRRMDPQKGDIMVALPFWWQSEGSIKEMELAKSMELDVLNDYDVNDVEFQ